MPTLLQRLVSILTISVGIVNGSPALSNWLPWSHTDGIQVRFPPTVDQSLDATWTSPPAGFIYGNWKVRYSSRALYGYLYNFEADCYPALPTNVSIPAGRNIDLTSFQLAITGNISVDNHVITVFGYDYPQTIAPYVFQFRGEGKQSDAINDWELLAWGYDKNDVAWRLEYETAYRTATQYGEPGINFLSRADDGPDHETYQQVLVAMQKTFASNKDLLTYATNITELPRDSRRSGKPPVACDMACMQNIE